MADKYREKDQLISKLVDYATGKFAEGDFETVKNVLVNIAGEKIQSPKFKYLRAKYALHEGMRQGWELKRKVFRNTMYIPSGFSID